MLRVKVSEEGCTVKDSEGMNVACEFQCGCEDHR